MTHQAPVSLTQVNAGAVVRVHPCTQSSATWLAKAERGAYTTARTVDQGRRVLKLTSHIDRLAMSANLMLRDAQPAEGASGPSFTPQQLRQPLMQAAAAAVLDLQRQQQRRGASASTSAGSSDAGCASQPHGEVKLTVLLTWQADAADDYDLWCHAQPLPPRPEPPISVQIRGAPRQNARAKDSEWVRQRAALEAEKPAGCEEVVLSTPGDVGLLEGLSSNFFVLQGGCLVTAEEGVLSGTIRELVLEACADLQLPVQLRSPLLAELPSWQAAFISSTSRLLLPVDRILYAQDGQDLVHVYEQQHPLARQLEAAVAARVLECSEPLGLQAAAAGR